MKSKVITAPLGSKLTAKVLDRTFLKLYNGINLANPDNLDIKKLQKSYHIILVPNHQSHADYIALQYLLHKNGKIPVYVAGGINMNIFPIGDLFRRCGAFFFAGALTMSYIKSLFKGIYTIF